jgi:membrane protease YdiL (CAAX protease family)
MRRAAAVVLGLWTLGMAAIFVFGIFFISLALKSIVIDGQLSTLNGEPQTWEESLFYAILFFGIYLSFSAGCVAFGVSLLRKLLRPAGTGVIPVRPLRGANFLARRPDPYLLAFLVFWNAVAWGIFLNAVVHLIVGGGERHDLVVFMAVGGVFLLFGQAAGHQLTWVVIDIQARTWRCYRGVWPFRSVATGSLNEARQMAVAVEIRAAGESGLFEVAVARLEWSEPDRSPLLLVEAPISKYRTAVRRWAGEVANLLGLPLADKLEVATPTVQQLDV